MRKVLLHPKAVPGAEYAPIPPPPIELFFRAGFPLQLRRGATQEDRPGPHMDPGLWPLSEASPRIADLSDADTALLVLRRVVLAPQHPVRAHSLLAVLLRGKWDRGHAEALGEICERLWAPRGVQ